MKILKVVLLLFLQLSTTKFVEAQYTKLFDFMGTSNGSNPGGDLFFDGTYLYGMTSMGGANDDGTIFKILPDGTGYIKLLDFSDTLTGRNPNASLISDGIFLYGTASKGGAKGYGTIFKIMLDGTGFTKIFDFDFFQSIGSYPMGSLFFDGTFLLGTTADAYYGTIFKIKTDGTGFLKIFDFTGTNGRNPYCTLISDGNFLYGTTLYGGTNDEGTVFKIKTDGSQYTMLYDFGLVGGTNGRYPIGSLYFDGIYLYGMTSHGGTVENFGVIYKIKPDGTGFSKLMEFTGTPNGEEPNGHLISDGTYLYGMAQYGGAFYYGTIFRIKPDGAEFSILHNFNVNNGRTPRSSLIVIGNYFYGMTLQGGIGTDCATNFCGVIFKFHPTGMAVAENKVERDFTVCPNPFIMQTTFLANTFLTNANITVYNCFGQTVKQIKNISGQTITFYRDNLPSGLYFLQLTKDNKVISADKFVITDK